MGAELAPEDELELFSEEPGVGAWEPPELGAPLPVLPLGGPQSPGPRYWPPWAKARLGRARRIGRRLILTKLFMMDPEESVTVCLDDRRVDIKIGWWKLHVRTLVQTPWSRRLVQKVGPEANKSNMWAKVLRRGLPPHGRPQGPGPDASISPVGNERSGFATYGRLATSRERTAPGAANPL